MPKITVNRYEIILTDIETGVQLHYTYTSLKEAEMYYVEYKKAFKHYKIELYALLKEDIM